MRKICVVTGTRAEYGLLKKLLGRLRDESGIELQIVATGMHLSSEFGHTIDEILADGFTVDERIDMELHSDTQLSIVRSMGLGAIGFAKVFERLRPDMVVILGDRFEILVAAQAALIFNIPIAHIHGGEATEGLIDEAIRHAVTKMSHLHFAAADAYRKRIIQMGERPERVFNFGSLALDAISTLSFLDRPTLEAGLGIQFGTRNFLITHHPVTLQPDLVAIEIEELLAALESFPDAHLFFTMPNADTSGHQIEERISAFALSRPNSWAFKSLGQLRYLSLMRQCQLVVGNSSSGLVEAPAFAIPTINIGDRQKGRLQANTIVQARPERGSIASAMEKALSPNFLTDLGGVRSPYGNGDAADNITRVLKETSLEGILHKRFYELT